MPCFAADDVVAGAAGDGVVDVVPVGGPLPRHHLRSLGEGVESREALPQTRPGHLPHHQHARRQHRLRHGTVRHGQCGGGGGLIDTNIIFRSAFVVTFFFYW